MHDVKAPNSKSCRRGASARTEPDLKWWQRSVVYEVAVISYQDSNGDGKGDLPGLIGRLDYIEWLGVDVLWLTPIYPSPMLDFGYDISDFCDVDPMFGTLADFDRLVEEVHRRGMRLILDYVPNHSSDQHPWFTQSRSSRENPKRHWYLWADPAAGGRAPNNWLSRFGGSAWQWDERSGQYYYHSFLREQPDLNWSNPELRAAMGDVLRFWLGRDVDGFRVDASAVLAKDALLRDDPPDPQASADTPPPQRLKHVFTDDRPEAMRYLEEIRRVVDEFPDRVLAGEVQGKTGRIGHFYGSDHPRFHLPLNFALLDSPWDAVSLQAQIDAYLNAIPSTGWPDWVIGGHDKKRVASKTGQHQARILAMLFLTLKGTPFFFAGDELGMEQISIPADQVRDPFEKLVPGYGLDRDPERAPMRWNDGPKAGFTSGTPWLFMGDDVPARNVDCMQKDDRSLLTLYRRLLSIRRNEPALVAGEYQPVRSVNDVLMYVRVLDKQKFFIGLNLTPEPRAVDLLEGGQVILSTYLDDEGRKVGAGPMLLRPDEGLIVKHQN